MNKRYIDFVPNKSRTQSMQSVNTVQVILPAETPVARPAERPAVKPVARPVSQAMSRPSATDAARAAKSKKVAMKPSSVMGDGMVRMATKKPLPAKKPAAKVAASTANTATEEILEQVTAKADNLEQTMKVPQARFVNTDKVVKRPLSKNVYQKKIVEPKEEEPQAPVTIIQKPEKDSKVGLIVTIIITIILGAAAGTVAFLLLPK